MLPGEVRDHVEWAYLAATLARVRNAMTDVAGSSFRNQRENGKAERGDGPGSARDDRPRGVSALRTLDDRAKPGAHLAGKNFR